MEPGYFEGFPVGLLEFLQGLARNNTRDWFDDHRAQYRSEVLKPLKQLTSELGLFTSALNPEFETAPTVGRTISRINNYSRFQKDRQPYKTSLYVSFPRRGHRVASEALLYIGIDSHGVSVGFYPGGSAELQVKPLRERISSHIRLFDRYLAGREIAERYWELAGGEHTPIVRWPLPKTARRWAKLESFTVGEYFPASDALLSSRAFLHRAQEIFLDLYPLWLFAASENLRADFEHYSEKAHEFSEPLKKAAV